MSQWGERFFFFLDFFLKDFLSLKEITKEKSDRFVYIQIKNYTGQKLIKIKWQGTLGKCLQRTR